jgi:hypothetical protein
MLVATALLALTATHAAAHAQVESNLPGAGFDQPKSPTPTLHVFSRETVIDVLVTDDKGQPVRGLTQSNFTVEEDNKPQPIRSFSEYDKTAPPTSNSLLGASWILRQLRRAGRRGSGWRVVRRGAWGLESSPQKSSKNRMSSPEIA